MAHRGGGQGLWDAGEEWAVRGGQLIVNVCHLVCAYMCVWVVRVRACECVCEWERVMSITCVCVWVCVGVIGNACHLCA